MADPCILGINALDPEIVYDLLKTAGIHSQIEAITPLKGGANNRVYRIDCKNSEAYVLKSYFQHTQDLRPRLKAEFEFLTFAWSQGIRSVPQPLSHDPLRNFALYSHLNANLPTSLDTVELYTKSAASFLTDLNFNRKLGKHLFKASEACFRIDDHFLIVNKRLEQLLGSPNENYIEKKLHSFLNDRLIPFWSQIEKAECKAALHDLAPSEEDYIISPSDFGMHNALISSENTYYFIDFEYAGWDDPAKTILDFFSQPKLPIPIQYFDLFAQRVASLTTDSKKTLARAQLLLPACKVKWCCIILNIFLKAGRSRREFSNNEQASLQERQLNLAENYLLGCLDFFLHTY